MKSTQELQHLCAPLSHIIATIQDGTDAFYFLRDLLTEAEMIELNQRLLIAHMLSKKIPYTKIEEDTGASSTTIARVSKYLHGTYGGYRKCLSYLD